MTLSAPDSVTFEETIAPILSSQLLSPSQRLQGTFLVGAGAVCNLGTILISHNVRENPAPTAAGLAAALAAVCAGAFFKLQPQ